MGEDPLWGGLTVSKNGPRLDRAGAFIGDAGVNAPVPIRTLSDEFHDEPEPEDSDRVPEPEPPGRLRRLLDRLRRPKPTG